MAEQMSLFGADPELLRQGLMAQQNATAMEQAKLGALEVPAYIGARAGMQIGQGLNVAGGAALGEDLRDPRVIKAEKMKNAVANIRSKGVSVTSGSAYYVELAKELQAQGLDEEAAAVAEKAYSLESTALKDAATLQKIRAEAQKALREKRSNIGQLQAELQDAVAAGNVKAAKELQAQIDKLNTGEFDVIDEGDPNDPNKRRKVLVEKDTGRVIRAFLPFEQKPQVQILNSAKEGLQAWANVWEKDYNRWSEQTFNLPQVEDRLGEMERIAAQNNLNLGSLGNLRSDVSRTLLSLGLQSKAEIDRMNDTDLLKAYAMDFILPKMKMLGGSDSNEELRKIESSFANNTWDISTIRRILEIARRDVTRAKNIQKNFEAHMAAGKNPLDFNFKSGRSMGFVGGNDASVSGIPQPKKAPTETPKPVQVTPDMRAKIRAANPGKELTDEQIDAAIQRKAQQRK